MRGVSTTYALLTFYLVSFTYTSRASSFFFLLFFFFSSSFSLLSFCGEFLLQFTSWLYSSMGSFSYTSHADFVFMWEFLLHIPCCLQFYAGSFSDTSRAGFIFMQEVSLTHTVLPSFLYLGRSYLGSSRTSVFFISLAAVISIWGDSLTHPVLTSVLP